MSPMRVLVVEDERVLAGGIAAGLRSELMAVDVTYDGDTALERLAVNDYDVVVLDRDLPVVHGDDVCRALVAAGGPGCPPRRCWSVPVSAWIPRGVRPPATAGRSRCVARSSGSWKSCCAPTARWCPPSSCWKRRGTRTSTRSPTWYG